MSNVTDDPPVSPQPKAAPRKPRSKPIEMRTVHRVLSLIACLFLLYVGVTGTFIQALDLKALVSGAPESDATMQSINEGKFGNGYYSAVARSDWSAPALPADIDVGKAFTDTMAAFRKADPTGEPTLVEIRTADGKLIGQAGYPDPNGPPDKRRRAVPMTIHAVDLNTGESVPRADLLGTTPPESLRQMLKEWHRFWGPSFYWTRDKPGVYLQVLIGISMWVLIVTGLVMYFRLLKQRRKMKRPQLFWMNNEYWRSLHRGVSVGAAVLLILVAASGTWLGFESSYATFAARGPGPGGRDKPLTVSDADAPRIALAAVKLFRAKEPTTPIRVVRARYWSGKAEGVIVTANVPTRQVVYEVDSGEEMKLSSPHYPKSPFPLGMDVHEWVKHFHSGYLFGLPARFLDLLAGLSLVFLSLSGIWMYYEMYRKRASAGRKGLFWK